MSLCNDVTTKAEYDKSNDLLKIFLYEDETIKVIGTKCRNAVLNLQEELRSDEAKYAGYVRHSVKNAMGVMTTSAVEGHNRVLKHGPMKVNAQHHLHNVMTRIMKTIRWQLSKSRNHATRQLSRTNTASNAPTKQYLINEGQALMDRNFDMRCHVKSAQVSPNRWIAWLPFKCKHKEDCAAHHEYLRIPQFLQVHELELNTIDDKNFIHCKCEKRRSTGIPCTGLFRIVDNGRLSIKDIMTAGMVDVSWMKLFHSHFGKDDEIGISLLLAQQQCFLYENHGTCVSAKVATNIRGRFDATYPIRGPNTSDDDLMQALYVRSKNACTFLELEEEKMKPRGERWKLSRKFADDERKKPPCMHSTSLTAVAERMKSEVEESVDRSGTGMLPSEHEKDTYYKKWQEDMKAVLCNERVDAKMMQDIDNCMTQLVETINDLTIHDGEGEQRDSCLEMFGTSSAYSALVGRKRGAV